MLYVFGDCYVEIMHDLKKSLDGIELIGVRGLWSSSLNSNELEKIPFVNTKNYVIPVDQNIILFLGHADIRDIGPIYVDIEKNVDSYVKFATTYLKPYFQNVYFAEPWPIWSDCPRKKLLSESYFKKALHLAAEKYNTKVVITQEEIYEYIGKNGVPQAENVPEKNSNGMTWPDEYFEKVLNLIVSKSLTL